jgi:hypothetical protein
VRLVTKSLNSPRKRQNTYKLKSSRVVSQVQLLIHQIMFLSSTYIYIYSDQIIYITLKRRTINNNHMRRRARQGAMAESIRVREREFECVKVFIPS